ncbi:MAG: hypothetical protein JWP74_635 [Marmoricola sp.]|nr:hypothetical protein [Marmoricola sp.]
MRRMSLVLIALGAFLIVLGPMVRWYAYPHLAVAPANERTTTGLIATDATVFDVGTLKDITTTLHTKVNTIGDASTPNSHPGLVTYTNSTSTLGSDGTMLSRMVERMTFDARTGESSTTCCNDFISTTEGVETPIVHHGIVANFPFETQKKTYQFWDTTLLKAVPISYRGTTSIQGLKVYKFEQTIPPTEYGTQDVPLSLLGLIGTSNVKAQEMYGVHRTLLVEPNTGVIITRTDDQLNTLDYNGTPRVTLTKAVNNYDAKTIAKNINDYGAQGSRLHLVHSVVPQVSFALGLLMLAAGIFLGRRRPTAAGTRVRELADARS